jgi:steroid delta-isomerase
MRQNDQEKLKTATRAGGVTLPTAGWEALEANNRRYRSALETYVESVNSRDVDRLVALFAEDAVIEDPYGGTRHNISGRAAIREFYEFVVAKTRMELRVVTGSGGNAAAMAVRAHVGNDVVDNISVALFDEAGLILRYTTYWGPCDRRSAG